MSQERRWRKVTVRRGGKLFWLVGAYGNQATDKGGLEGTLEDIDKGMAGEEVDGLMLVGDTNARVGESKTNANTNVLVEWAKERGMMRIEPNYTGVKATCCGVRGGWSVVDHVYVSKGMMAEAVVKVEVQFHPYITVRHAPLLVDVEWKMESGGIKGWEKKEVVSTGLLSDEETKEVWEKVGDQAEELGFGLEMKGRGRGFELDEKWRGWVRKVKEEVSKIHNKVEGGRRKRREREAEGESKKKRYEKVWEAIMVEFVSVEEGLSEIQRMREEDWEEEWDEQELELDGVVKELLRNAKQDQRKFWEIIRRGQVGGREELSRVIEGKDGRLVESKSEVMKVWVDLFQRKRKGGERVSNGTLEWFRRVEGDVKRWAGEEEVVDWWDRKFERKEIYSELKGMKARGAGGGDGLTVKFLLAGGEQSLKLVEGVVEWVRWWEEVPRSLREEVIVPLYKRGRRVVGKNHRPVTLLVVVMKLLQRLVYGRVDKFLKERGKRGFCGKGQYGGCRGRDRLVMVWLIEALSLVEEREGTNGGTLYFVFQDVENAFPGMWQEAVDWILRDMGVNGKLWRLARLMEKGVHAKVRVNGNESCEFEQRWGGSQGAVSQPKRFNLLQRRVMEEIEEMTNGVVVMLETGGRLELKVMGFVDDYGKLFGKNGVEDIERWLQEREKVAEKWRFMWKKVKDMLLVRGKGRNNNLEFERKGETKLESEKEVEVLGEVLTRVPGRSREQVRRTVERMKKQANKVKWLVSVREAGNIGLVEGMVVMMVESVAASKLVIVNMTKEEKNMIERVKAGIARSILGVGGRVSKRSALRELGWSTTWSMVVKAKLGMLGRLLRVTREEDEEVFEIVKIRRRQVEEGDRRGVMGECYDLLWTYGHKWLETLWKEGGRMPKGRYKRGADAFVVRMEELRWEEWACDQRKRGLQVGFLELDEEKGRKEYVGLERRKRRLVAAVRLEDTLYDRTELKRCSLCGEEGENGSKHLVVGCSMFEVRRKNITKGGEGGWKMIMGAEVKELVDFLEWINSMCVVLGGRGLVAKEDRGGEGDRGGEVEEWFDVREKVCERLGGAPKE